ncbi:MAG: hypothetical protein NT062_11490 [Proteobacteria bacterium]|nr:hypothetical protein [Pseudomonadota bacterium]
MKVLGVVVFSLAFVLTSCHMPPAVPALPSKGGPPWVEVASAHFTIWTDSPERALGLVQAMERLREVIYGTTLFGRRDEGYRVFVVALANKEEVGAYLPVQFSAYASGVGALLQPVIVVAADALDTTDTRRVFTHELAHVISYGPLPDQPHWFAEALASFYETIEVDGTRVDLGKPVEGRARQLHDEHPLPLAQLFACREHACMNGAFYATAWALFTFLATEHADELFAYMNALAVAPAGASDALWAQAFPSLAALDAADHAFLSWVAHGKVLVRQYTVKHDTWPATDRVLSDADALAARGVAQYIIDHTTLPKDVTAALALDPTNVVARMIESRAAGRIAAADARAVAAAHPDDWRAWFLVLHAVQTGDEAHAAHTRMCALVTTHAIAVPPGFCS